MSFEQGEETGVPEGNTHHTQGESWNPKSWMCKANVLTPKPQSLPTLLILLGVGNLELIPGESVHKAENLGSVQF